MSARNLEVVERIGSGDVGTVYRGTDTSGPVAIKVLHAHLASDVVVRSRFLREARLLASVRHPNVVKVHDVVEVNGLPAMTMELLPGGDLRSVLMEAPAALELLRTLVGALGDLHRRGIVHRDLRPEHILLDSQGHPRIIDFGMASIRDLSGLTRSTVMTTRSAFVDPYTWGRGRLVPAADLYSLGAIIHTLITGTPPPGALFGRSDSGERELSMAAMRERAGEPLATIVNSMLDAPGRRPRSAAEVADWIDGEGLSGGRTLTECLFCGAAMPTDAPLCLSCGEAVLEVRLDADGEFIALRKISEDREVLGPFLTRLRLLSDEPLGDIRLIIGDARMYSREEQKSGVRLPVRIADSIHPDSVDRIVTALTGDHPREIRITRYPMAQRSRVKRGPLIRLESGRVLPRITRPLLRSLTAAGPNERPATAGTPGHDLATECRYAVSIAAARLGSDPATEALADEEHFRSLLHQLLTAVEQLGQTLAHLSLVNLGGLYADLERLDPSRSVETEAERDRVLALFGEYAETERAAAALEQRIVLACRLLETVSPATAVETFREIGRVASQPG